MSDSPRAIRWKMAAQYKYTVLLTGQLKDTWHRYERAHPEQQFAAVVRRALKVYLKDYLLDTPQD